MNAQLVTQVHQLDPNAQTETMQPKTGKNLKPGEVKFKQLYQHQTANTVLKHCEDITNLGGVWQGLLSAPQQYLKANGLAYMCVSGHMHTYVEFYIYFFGNASLKHPKYACRHTQKKGKTKRLSKWTPQLNY